MSQLTAATCTRCGAPLRLDPSAPTQVCSFCGNAHLFAPAPPRQQQAPQPPFSPPFAGAAPRVVGPHATPSAAPAVVGVALAIFVLAGITAAMILMGSGGAGRGVAVGGAKPANTSAMPGGGGVVPAGERLQWSSNGTSVVPARVDGDSVEDFVGRYVILDLAGKTTQTLFVGGFSGATLERVWKAGPYGTLSEAAGATHFTVVGDRVAVADFRSILHVLDVATGKELQSVRLSDRARSVCAPSDGRKQVWVEVADRNHQVVDLDSGKSVATAARPAWCRRSISRFYACAGTRAGCTDEASQAPTQAGFGADLVLTEGSTGVATGYKSPGTPVPMAVGFDATRKAVTWTATIPADPAASAGSPHSSADLADGRFFTTYGLSGQQGSRLVSLDAKTGARRWDVAVPRSESGSGVEGLAATATRVYVPHWTWIDVFEAGSGKLVGTVGMW